MKVRLLSSALRKTAKAIQELATLVRAAQLAQVAKSEDALGSDPSGLTPLEVRILS